MPVQSLRHSPKCNVNDAMGTVSDWFAMTTASCKFVLCDCQGDEAKSKNIEINKTT